MVGRPGHSEVGRGSGQIAANRVLDLKRFDLPLRLVAAAQPRLSFCPPRTAVPAGEHHPRPGLDDMAERPQVPGRPAMSTPGPVPARTGPGRRQARRHGPARPARTGPDRLPARHRSRHGSSHPDQSSAQKCDSVCSGEPHDVLAAARYGHDRAISFTEADGRVATVIPPKYRPTPSSTR
jgi:hypothetical protein